MNTSSPLRCSAAVAALLLCLITAARCKPEPSPSPEPSPAPEPSPSPEPLPTPEPAPAPFYGSCSVRPWNHYSPCCRASTTTAGVVVVPTMTTVHTKGCTRCCGGHGGGGHGGHGHGGSCSGCGCQSGMGLGGHCPACTT